MVVHHRFIDPKMVVSFRGALLTRRNYIKNNLGYYFLFFLFYFIEEEKGVSNGTGKRVRGYGI